MVSYSEKKLKIILNQNETSKKCVFIPRLVGIVV